MSTSSSYRAHYSYSAFWQKIHNSISSAPKELINAVLTGYYMLTDPDVSYATKSILLIGLGYFIFPFDLILDAAPVVGYIDDLAVILDILAHLTTQIKPHHQKAAKCATM